MHRGVQALLAWIHDNPRFPGLSLAAPAAPSALSEVEDRALSPLPTDLRLLLGHYNGGALPTGTLLSASGTGPDSILGAFAGLAQLLGRPLDDAELPLPYFRTSDGSLLAFDRSAAPVADTWPVVDCPLDVPELRLVHRTFDGWCRLCLGEWRAPDFGSGFSLDRYLNGGLRHASVEPDVAAAHATVAHARRRAGQPEEALASYLVAARCVPQLAFCDWEGLKLAVLLRDVESALIMGRRLCSHAPPGGWLVRGTTPRQVADALALLVTEIDPPEPLLMQLDHLSSQADETQKQAILAIRRAVYEGEALPPPQPIRPTAVAPTDNVESLWKSLERAYSAGSVRDDDLLLDPAYRPAERYRPLADLLRIRREF